MGESLKQLIHKQLHWNIFYPNLTVDKMMDLHRFIEVAEIAPEYTQGLEKEKTESAGTLSAV